MSDVTSTTLPVIVVSAKSEAAATHFISELIDKEAEEAAGARVWHIVNKYYSARVRVVPLADGAAPPPLGAGDGLVVYLAADELRDQGGAALCAARAAGGAGAGVRVLAAEAARLPGALVAAAARLRLEPVALRGEHSRAEPAGPGAARAALHAHCWPGSRALQPPAGPEEGAELWVEALGALGGVRALPHPERRAAAEALLRTLCRALGDDLQAL